MIDTHLRVQQQISERIPHKLVDSAESSDGFVAGLDAVLVERLIMDEGDQPELVNQTPEEAKIEADQILENAKKEAEQYKSQLYEEAKKKGYEEGFNKGKQESLKQKADYESKMGLLQKEYEKMVDQLEPQFVDIMASLIEKITGVLVEDKEDVILYLVRKALLNSDKSMDYSIKVSNDDYEYLYSRKNDLLNVFSQEVNLNIMEDGNLSKNQCLIETEDRVINCSLDVQLSNLITDLKLLGKV
jgi:flagellar assembly protein FliH